MELTTLLSQVFGLYLVIGGLAIMIRQRYFMPVVGAFAHERLTRMITSILEVVAGLFMVLTHQVWYPVPAALVTIFGWMLLLEGAFYLLASDELAEELIRKFNTPAWYRWGGIVSILLGVYLAGSGFGWF